MDPSIGFKLSLLLILILFSGFFSGSESAFFSLGSYRVRRLRSFANKSYQAAQKLLSSPTRLIATLLAGNEIVNALLAIVGASLVYDLFHGRVEESYLPVLSVAFVLPFVLIFGEMVPKTIGIRSPEKFVSKVARPLLLFSTLITPLREFLQGIPHVLFRIFGIKGQKSDEVTEGIFRTLVDTGRKEGILDAQEQELIHNVFNLDDIKIFTIMTPWSKVAGISSSLTLEEALFRIREEGYSRYPVLEEEGEKVSGVLYTKDLLALGTENPGPIEPYVRPALFIEPERMALDLFAIFRSRKTHFAVVKEKDQDRPLGIVTFEDVLEEVFGEIRDERDVEKEETSNS